MPNNFFFNDAALLNLVSSPAGAFGDRLRLVAETITESYNDEIQGVWQNQPARIKPVADYDIVRGEWGLEATIGIVDPGIVRKDDKKTISEVIDIKFGVTEKDKFKPLIMQNWDEQLR